MTVSQILHMISLIELEQTLDVAAYASLSSVKAEDKLYDKKRVCLHLKLMMNSLSQSSSSAAAYNIIAECLQKDTHSYLYSS